MRIRSYAWLVALASIAFAGCGDQGPLAPYEWQGVGQTSSRTYVVRLVYARYGDSVMGSYYFDGRSSPSGKVEGTIDGDTLVLTLSPSTSCTYAFVGTITETRLAGTFVPDPCPGGVSGEWDLLRANGP